MVHSMYISMYIPYTFHAHSILHLSFVLLCTFPGKVLVDIFAHRRASKLSLYRVHVLF